jgi:PAS domain S-box-containing protein
MMPISNSLPWFFVVILAIASGSLLFIRMNYRKKYEELKDEYEKRDLLLNSVAEGVYGLDLNGNCTFCNAATLKLLGYQSKTELIGSNVHDLFHHSNINGRTYKAEDCKACLAYKQNREIHLEDEVFWRADGTSFQVEYWSYPVRKAGKLVGAVISFVDITDRKEIETRLKETNRELDAFVYTVSHDLRTPISVVVGYADFIKEYYRPVLPDEVIEHLATIETQGHRMAALVEDLLTLAMVGTLKQPDAAVDGNAELAQVLDELTAEIEKSGATIVANELPEVKLPGTLLAQIFQNLVGNALRYAGAGSRPIEIGGERSGSKVRFYVRDHGKGIPEDERDRIFDVFYRGSTSQGLIGSGVGLATVMKIARLYSGRAWVEDTPGGGATFWVEMSA